MTTLDLNLASRPFRNERLPQLLLAAAGLGLAGATVWHAMVIGRVLPGRTSALHREVAALEQKAATMRAETRGLQRPKPPTADLAHWAALKGLVDRRAFSWTSLFAVLEAALPDGIRLVSIAPQVEKGVVKLEVDAVARSYEDGLDFIRILEERPEFENVLPLRRGDEGTTFTYTMTYLPAAAAPPPAAADDRPEDEAGPDGEPEAEEDEPPDEAASVRRSVAERRP